MARIDGSIGGENKMSKEENPLISIITVVYNGEEFLEETIQSVLNQDYENIEYIIIDGGSTDSTIDIVKKYEHKISYWGSEPDRGIYDAMNKGVALARGELIGIIHADDYYLPNTISTVVNLFNESEADIYHGDMTLIDRTTGKDIEFRSSIEWKLYVGMSLNHPSVFINRNLYRDFSYSTELKMASDYNLLLRAKVARKKFYHIPKILTHMRSGGVSEVQENITIAETKQIKKDVLGKYLFFLGDTALFMNRVLKCLRGF